MFTFEQLNLLAKNIKVLSAEMVEKAKSGHPGTAVAGADMLATLFSNCMNFNPSKGTWANRDRFILSAGHACAMLYSILHILGYKEFTMESLKNLRQLNYITSGHPEINPNAGIEVTTGPLGEGIAMAIGIAIGESILNAKYPNIINHHTFVFAGDGCLMEGVSFEALSLAGTLNLKKLVVIYDKNNITIDGDLKTANQEDISKRMEALGFKVISIDGHNLKQILDALNKAKQAHQPSFIISNTEIAHLAGDKAGSKDSHGSPLGQKNIDILKNNLDWDNEAFTLNLEVRDSIQALIKTKVDNYNLWEKKVKQDSLYNQFKDFTNAKLSNLAYQDLINLALSAIKNKSSNSTRVCSGQVLEIFSKYLPNLIGGSADLSSSNHTIHKNSKVINSSYYNGNYLHYGVREHAMGAIMNGLACSNFIPYGGTFLVFSDFMRPAIRLSALMNLKVWYVFTHDNISLGADGPTHQPIEQIESLRLIPNLQLFRPADLIETIEAYLIALYTNKPTIFILGRSNVPTLRTSFDIENNLSSKGGYILQDANNAVVSLISSGSELHLCLEVAKLLKTEAIAVKVVSMPSLDIFKQQDTSYKKSILGKTNIVVQAGNATGWAESLGGNTLVYDLKTFGISGTSESVMNHFNFTSDKIVQFVKNTI